MACWLNPPLLGQRGTGSAGGPPLTRSTPQLPPLGGLRHGTPPQAAATDPVFSPHGIGKSAFANGVQKPNDLRGAVAAAWSRKLPCGVPSRAVRMVRTHLAYVDESMQNRQPSQLEKALQEASSGNNYQRTVSVVRRSRSVPALHRHALESALASHIVRARVELTKWQKGIQEINEHRRLRDAEQLKLALSSWQFAEDDPVVLSAKQDIQRWKYIEEQMPSVLRKAVAERDMETIRSNLKELTHNGPTSVEGVKEARSLLRRYDSQARALRDAVALRQADAMEAALNNFEFGKDDPNYIAAQQALERHHEQMLELRAVLDADKCDVDGSRLVALVNSWEYDGDGDENMHRALMLLQEFRVESETLENLLQQDPVDLVELRSAVDNWPFARGPTSCTALTEATNLVTAHEEGVRIAVDRRDGWAVRGLLEAGSAGRALGEQGEGLAAQANALHSRHANATNELLGMLGEAQDFEAGAKDDITRACDQMEKDFSADDPTLAMGRCWLSFHDSVRDRSHQELALGVQAGFPFAVESALQRCQGLQAEDPAMVAAQELSTTGRHAWQAAGALALGVAPARVPVAGGAQEGSAREVAEKALMPLQDFERSWISELKAFKCPPRIVPELFQVLASLLSGTSNYAPLPTTNPWEAAQKALLADGATLLSKCVELPFWVGVGQNAGVTRARDLWTQFQNSFGATWCLERMNGISLACARFFEFTENVLRLDDIVQEAMRGNTEASTAASTGAAGEEHGELLRTLAAGLAGSRQLAAVWLVSGGDNAELEQCLERARSFAESAEYRLEKAREALSELCPTDSHSGEVGQDLDHYPSILNLTVQWISGELLTDRLEITEAATGLHLKELISDTFREQVPPVGEQRLLYGQEVIQDFQALALQGIPNGAVLTLVRVEVSFLRRLDILSSTMHALDASQLDGPGAQELMQAAAHIGPGKDRKSGNARGGKLSRRRLEGVLSSILGFVEEARAVAFDAARGKPPQDTRLAFFVDTQPLRPTASPPMLSMNNATAAMRWLRSSVAGEPLASVLAELEALMHKFYAEFVPCYAAFGAARAASEEALYAVQLAEEALALGSDDGAGLVAAISGAGAQADYSTGVTLNTTLDRDQVNVLGELGLSAPAPHVQRAVDLAGRAVAKILERPPGPNEPVAWARYVEQLLVTYLGCISQIGKQLTALAKALPASQMGKLLETSGSPSFMQVDTYKLVVAVIWVVKKDCQADAEFDEARRTCGKGLAEMLAKWSPLNAGTSVEQLQAAERRILALWPRFGVEHGNAGSELLLRRLYNWAVSAVALLPVMPACQELPAAQRAVRAAVAKLDGTAGQSAELQEDVWLEVRRALSTSTGEPWRWLQLIGCKDPRGFYKQHGLQVDPAASPGPSPSAASQVAAAPALNPAASEAAAAASVAAEEEARAADDDFEDDEDAVPPPKPSSEGFLQPSADKAEPASAAADAPRQLPGAEEPAEAAGAASEAQVVRSAEEVAAVSADAAVRDSRSATAHEDGPMPHAAETAGADMDYQDTLPESATADDAEMFEADRGEEAALASSPMDAAAAAGDDEQDGMFEDDEQEPDTAAREPDEFDDFEAEGHEDEDAGEEYDDFDKDEDEEPASRLKPARNYSVDFEGDAEDQAPADEGFEDDDAASKPEPGAEVHREYSGFEPSYTADLGEFEKDDFEEDEAHDDQPAVLPAKSDEFDRTEDFEPDDEARAPLKTDYTTDFDDFEADEPSSATAAAGQPSLEANYTADFEEGAEDFEDEVEAAEGEDDFEEDDFEDDEAPGSPNSL